MIVKYSVCSCLKAWAVELTANTAIPSLHIGDLMESKYETYVKRIIFLYIQPFAVLPSPSWHCSLRKMGAMYLLT